MVNSMFQYIFIQRDLYEESFRSLVESVLGGYNGKTGSNNNILVIISARRHFLHVM